MQQNQTQQTQPQTMESATKWKKVEGQVHNFSENPELIGIYTGMEEGQYGQNIVIERAHDGQTVIAFGKTALLSKFKLIPLGAFVKIMFRGTKTSQKTGRMYQNFEVFVGQR